MLLVANDQKHNIIRCYVKKVKIYEYMIIK